MHWWRKKALVRDREVTLAQRWLRLQKIYWSTSQNAGGWGYSARTMSLIPQNIRYRFETVGTFSFFFSLHRQVSGRKLSKTKSKNEYACTLTLTFYLVDRFGRLISEGSGRESRVCVVADVIFQWSPDPSPQASTREETSYPDQVPSFFSHFWVESC